MEEELEFSSRQGQHVFLHSAYSFSGDYLANLAK